MICPDPGTIEDYMLSRANDLPVDVFPDIYSGFVDAFGTFTYEGSLTSPPCTENVYWNIADEILTISVNQATDISKMISCFTSKTTCKHASAASEFGRTSRPPQDLNGREIIHRCQSGANFQHTPAKAPKVKKYKKEKKPNPYYSILFPWFITIVGVVVYFILTRFIHSIPYTAILFLLGTSMGVGISYLNQHDQLTKSISMWENINGELLLVAFLPGLLFKDSYSLNVALFRKSLSQTLLMAFPMVLAGTTLLALVAYYMLPFGWSFNFCMTFGAILSATDPVAVSALLNELGAPPRLKMHISGESLLNDGSAIVFYAIFKALFLYELGLGGEKIDFAKGIVKFLEMALGAAAVGIAFGLGLTAILWFLNRRFSVEESIVQVCATIATAYLAFYVAEVILHMSGVLAVVCCGVTTKTFAAILIIDEEMMQNFWGLVEHLLNSVLFALGGLVWGTVISNADDARPEQFDGKDWGYLVLVFVMMTVIRFFLFGLFFPLISRIGMKSNWREAVFQAFGGLRGAVGIALAVSLDSELAQSTVRIDPRRAYTSQLFGITGGISFLTLFVNGILSGPLLRRLHLNRESPERTEIIKRYSTFLKDHMLDSMIRDLGMKQFAKLDFQLIQHYVHELSDISFTDIKKSIRRVKESTPVHLYYEPNIDLFKTVVSEEELAKLYSISRLKLREKFQATVALVTRKNFTKDFGDGTDEDDSLNDAKMKELRLVFIELLRSGYESALSQGLIDAREGTVDFILKSSVAAAEDEVSNGGYINDWKACTDSKLFSGNKDVREEVYVAAAFVRIHGRSQKLFKYDFCESSVMTKAEREVIRESCVQVAKAEEVFDSVDTETLKELMSLKMSNILLNRAALLVKHYDVHGLLKAQEAEHFYEEFEEAIKHLRKHKVGNTNMDVHTEDVFKTNTDEASA